VRRRSSDWIAEAFAFALACVALLAVAVVIFGEATK
jgi:hypothetical protein